MSDKINLQSYYMTGDSSLGFTIYNALTDHSILSGVSTKEASDFFWANDPTHPAISYLEKQNNQDHYTYDYFSNYNLELDVWMKASQNHNYNYDFTSDAYFHKEGEWDLVTYQRDNRQLEFNFDTTLDSNDDAEGARVTYVITNENNILHNDNDHEDTLDHLPELDSED